MNLRHGLLALALLVSLIAVGLFLSFSPTPNDSASAADTDQAAPPLQLDILAQVGPWPVASRLIGYQGRLWFANSVKGRNHNSADLWSLDPVTGEKRYERHLFSQDAGIPLVSGGLLYWPFEDALLSFGNGVIEVTDGETWQALQIPNDPIYHTNQVIDWQGGLLAITGTRNAGMQVSKDAGSSWTEHYIHPTPSTHVSRLKEMTVFKGNLYAALNDAKVKRLTVWTGSGYRTVISWPSNRYFNGLTVHKDAIYGIVGRGNEREIWKFDGVNSKRVGQKGPFTDITSDGDQLWIVSRNGNLWSSATGDKWARHGDLKKGRPISIQAVGDNIYVAGAGDDGKGIVWGRRGQSIPMGPKPSKLPSDIQPEQVAMDWNKTGQKLDALLSDRSTYGASGNGQLSKLIFQAAEQGPPPGFFATRLETKIPSVKVPAFGGNMELRAQDIGHSLLLSGMERAGHPNVPVKYLLDSWGSSPNSYEKYFELELSALRAVVGSGQDDSPTIDALLARLDFANDPPWLKSQIIGTLTAVSGEHFGYDINAWKKWAQSKRQDAIHTN